MAQPASSEQSGERIKVVVTRNVGPEAMSILTENPSFNVVVWPEDRLCDRRWLLDNIPGSTGVLVMLSDKVDEELLSAAGPSLRIVSTMSVGYEHVNLSLLRERGIKLGYTPDVLTDAVADLTVMLALMAGRNARETMDLVHAGQWPTTSWAPFKFCGPQLSTTTLSPTRVVGFIGFGRIAQATLTRLVPFGYKDCVYAGSPSSQPTPERDARLAQDLGLRSLRRVSLEEVAAQADIVCVLSPGGPSTYRIVNEKFLRAMKPTGVLVNTARGTCVDSDALAKALEEKWIWGAGLDVVEGEPNVTLDHPLLKQPRCVILPHIASATTETRLGMALLSARNLLCGLLGEEMPTKVKL